ncbi:uncharacterized protein LOC126984232 [Eriocheir sinensis]|uniref:uncharacterized protein LOC126984232 n=1 Tax=Eriocheir sinensis TaxID=95602 RepID=UPI0021C610C3|nr:uncharacterized protein LOC126984232 [Eriocheir sinensis]XP_050693745.1 uncharacterized protein LOC126984232 [Eriocheir sinensis]
MSEESNVHLIPLELYLMRGEGLEGFTHIPSSQLHMPGLQNQSVFKKDAKSSFQHERTCTNVSNKRTRLNSNVKRKNEALAKEVPQGESQVGCGTRKPLASESCLLQQKEVRRTLADISNLKPNDCVKNLSVTKKNRTLVSATHKHGENNAVSKDKANVAKQSKTGINGQEKGDKNIPKLTETKHPTASKRKINSEQEANNETTSQFGTESNVKQTSENTEQIVPAKRSRRIEATVSKELPEDMPRRSSRVRKQIIPVSYLLEDSDTSLLEPIKKARACRKVFPNKPKEQATALAKNRNENSDYEEQDENKKIPEPPVTQSAGKGLKTKEAKIKKGTKSNNHENKEGRALGKNAQSKSKNVEVRKINATHRSQEPTKHVSNVSINLELRRSTRQRKVNYRILEDLYESDESVSFPSKNKKQEKMKDKNNVVKNGRSAKRNIRSSSEKETLDKSVGNKSEMSDRKMKTMKAQVCLEKINLLKHGNPRYKEDKGSSVGSRENEKITSRNGGEEKQCKESERKSTVETKNTNKKTVSKSGQQMTKKKKPEKSQSEVPESAEASKITAKRGTLKYLHQREKYITALAKEAEGEEDDFNENPFFAKKKFKFTNLLPPSHEDTLIIKTPKRGIIEDQRETAVTPRTTLLGQLQPVTPSTHPYSPSPSLDSTTKKAALKQVYHWMKNKGRQPRRTQKVDHDMSRQNIHFTPIELPAVPENQSGNESDTADEYFDDGDSL